MRAAWIFVCRLSAYLVMATHFYRVKSWLHRLIWERDLASYPVETYTSLEGLARVVRTLEWKADGIRELWDAVSFPGKVQYDIHGKRPIGDCDEFAVYIATAINKSVERNLLWGIKSARLLSISWMNGWRPGGHSVCLIEFPESPLGKQFGYMDYGMPLFGGSVEEIVEKVWKRYNPAGELLSYTLSDAQTLKPLKTSWGLTLPVAAAPRAPRTA